MKENRCFNRRLRQGALLAVLLLPLARVEAAVPAELVVRGANVITVSGPASRAGSFAVAGGRFVAVGDSETIREWTGPETKVLDLAGKTVVPGFNDAHIHPRPIYPEDSRWASVDCSPNNVRTIEELIAALKRKVERTPPGQWVNGTRYQETKLGRHPTRFDLDRASTNHPIIISHSSGHQSVCNSFALQIARITRATEDPPGGKFVRDEQGELTGRLQERAAGIVRAAGPRTPDAPEADTIEAYRECFRQYVSRGITSVQVAGTSPDSARLMERARGDDLLLHFYFMFRESNLQEAQRLARETDAARGIRYGGIKLFHGNSLSAQTCWLSKPYENRPDYFGVPPARSQEALNKLILSVHEAGLQACVHSNGDREIDMLVTAFEFAMKEKPRANHRHRIEHGSVVTQELLKRIQKLGLVVVPHSYIWEHGDKMENYGEWRWDWMHAARSMLDLGIPIAGHSDAPVSAAEPLLRVQDMVTRTSAEGKVYGAKQRITAEEALRVWTVGGAFAEFQEDQKGSIQTGMLADFVVLSADPTRVPPGTIKDIVVERTFIGGKLVFERK